MAKDGFSEFGDGPRIALVQAAGEIVEGTTGGSGLFGGDNVIAGDDTAKAIRDAANDKSVKAILLRVDSPGGSVSASDQILDAVKKAQAKGIPVVVSMGSVAASGGYYISTSANKIVAEPGTITGFALPVGESIRVDTHAAAGTTITPFYDSLVAKVVVHGDTRARAIARMRGALDAFRIDGITTNLSLQRSIMDDARFASGAFGTRFLEAR